MNESEKREMREKWRGGRLYWVPLSLIGYFLTRIAHVKSESGSRWVVKMDFGDQIPKFEHDQLAQLENGRPNLDRTIQSAPQTTRTDQSCVFRQNCDGLKV